VAKTKTAEQKTKLTTYGLSRGQVPLLVQLALSHYFSPWVVLVLLELTFSTLLENLSSERLVASLSTEFGHPFHLVP